ncbi:MAG: hypothetical protein QHH07_09730 [Sedimentisphaerales bacterium]|nr:hypothetical protein [Sedimentisphaerales bacterium]
MSGQAGQSPICADATRSVRPGRRRLLIIWICVDLAIAAVLLVLLLYRPRSYMPVDAGPLSPDQYINDLLRQIQRQAREARTFEIVLRQDDINRALAGQVWFDPSGQVSLSGVTVQISKQGLTLMGTAELRGARFIVSGQVEPRLDGQGLLHLEVTKVKVGALNLTPVAMAIAKRMYHQRLQEDPIDLHEIRARIAGALLDGQAFEPVMDLGDRRVKLIGLVLQTDQAVLRLRSVQIIGAVRCLPHGPSFLAVKGGLTSDRFCTYAPTSAHPSSKSLLGPLNIWPSS